MEQAKDTVRVKLRVKGMHCQTGCANGIDVMLKEQDGILKSQTSFKDSASVIKFNPEKISEEKIISLIRERGFETKKITPKARD
ncbi:heavy-metal-associated domain-containing protein [Zunongwangia sp. H14]|uniref:heavy-metal-associated domain-containing protein n=1 Tax=Zunongwangia sp. H14 TaxID=3240792 RepID=UPI003567A387